MGTTRCDVAADGRRPSYQALVEENARLKEQVTELTRQVTKLTALLEEARREDKRQAAPFRKQDEPAAEPQKPGRKPGKRHGQHAHRSIPVLPENPIR